MQAPTPCLECHPAHQELNRNLTHLQIDGNCGVRVCLLVHKLYLERVLGVLMDCRDLQAKLEENSESRELVRQMGVLRACVASVAKRKTAALHSRLRAEGLELPTSPMPCVSCRTTLPTMSCAATLSAVPSAQPTCRVQAPSEYSRVLEVLKGTVSVSPAWAYARANKGAGHASGQTRGEGPTRMREGLHRYG